MNYSSKNEGEIKTFPEEQNMREFIASIAILKEKLKQSSRRKMIELRSSDLHKERKSVRSGISEGKVKCVISLSNI